MKIIQIVEKGFTWIPEEYSKQSTKGMRKIWGKESGGSFGLGKKSLGTDTETWS